jgi:hypothetical protein
MATMLKTWFVALTDGAVYPRKDIWKGRRRKAPETPPIDVRKDTANAAMGGSQIETSMSAVGKYM